MQKTVIFSLLAFSAIAAPLQAQPTAISQAEFAARPDWILSALETALVQGNAQTLAVVLPYYQQLESHRDHPLISKWAAAVFAKQQENYNDAIRLYREILADYAGHNVVRWQLALTLFENKAWEAAEDQFQKLRAEPLQEEVLQRIDQFLAAIRSQAHWTFSGGMTYLNDPNINNAPKAGTTIGNWSAPKRERGEGIGLNVALGKKGAWQNGLYPLFQLTGNGKYYWNNQKFNEFTGRATVGIGFQNANTTLEMSPFMEQTLYAGGRAESHTLKRYSKMGGIGIEARHWLNPQWQIQSSYEYGEQRYATRKHLNGNSHFISAGGLYFANAKRYYFANVHYTRLATRDKDDSYFRRGVNLGWQQEWQWGLSTRFTALISQKRYKAPMPIFRITQRNKEYGIQAAIWHRAVHYWGITPRLTYHFSKNQSNYAFNRYDKHRLFVTFNRTF